MTILLGDCLTGPQPAIRVALLHGIYERLENELKNWKICIVNTISEYYQFEYVKPNWKMAMRKFSSPVVALLLSMQLPLSAAELPQVGTIVVPEGTAPYLSQGDRFDQSHNMSALFCPSAGWCVVASDELHGIHRLKIDRDTGATPSVSYDAALDLGAPPQSVIDRHKLSGDLDEFDLEAIASADGKVYFFGSHGNKRKKGKRNAGAHLVAIASVADLETKTAVSAEWISLDPLFMADAVLGDHLNKQLQCGGLNIEGATILGDTVYIGVRIPSRGTDGVDPAAYVVSTPLADLAKEDFSAAKRHMLPTSQPFIGIRAMETVGDSVVVITGDAGVSDLAAGAQLECTANVNREDKDRPFQLRLWKPATGDSFEAETLVTFDRLEVDGELAKLEGIAADPGQSGAFFILYDGDDKVRYLTDVALK